MKLATRAVLGGARHLVDRLVYPAVRHSTPLLLERTFRGLVAKADEFLGPVKIEE